MGADEYVENESETQQIKKFPKQGDNCDVSQTRKSKLRSEAAAESIQKEKQYSCWQYMVWG